MFDLLHDGMFISMCFIYIYLCFQGEEKYQFENKNPFVQAGEETEVASVGYR